MNDKIIYFACTGGMGSSALGASLLQKVCKQRNMEYKVENVAIDDLDEHSRWVVCHASLAKELPTSIHSVYMITSFTDSERYETIMEEIKMSESNQILKIENVKINCTTCSSDEAILAIGKSLLEEGYIEEPYIEGMLNRDRSLTTYIGNSIAIPHGEYEVKQYVKKTGLSVMIYPEGIDWHGEVAKIVIGIAAKNDDHMEILANIACKLCEEEVVEQLVQSQDIAFIHDVLTKEEA